jgi:lipoprotein-anchoring transpeptidase ErfK/SrfK
MTVTSDGHDVGTYPVSLGTTAHPTRNGIKVIMEQGSSVKLQKPVDGHATIEYAQRLTYSGEYLCAAPWAQKDITAGVNSSKGSTYLSTADAKTLFSRFEIGDRVVYTGAAGSTMLLSSGYGDWQIDWNVWLKGGSVRTH